jgi:cytochrome c-type biogenesis protein CcmH/NrfG
VHDTIVLDTECPSIEDLAGFCAGGEENSEQLLEHVALCSRCFAIVQNSRDANNVLHLDPKSTAKNREVEKGSVANKRWTTAQNVAAAAMIALSVGLTAWVLWQPNASVTEAQREFPEEQPISIEKSTIETDARQKLFEAARSKKIDSSLESVQQAENTKTEARTLTAGENVQYLPAPPNTKSITNKNNRITVPLQPAELLAMAYTARRPFEYRLADNGYPDPAKGFDNATLLSTAQALITDLARAFPKDAEPMILDGQLSLLRKNYPKAIESLTTAERIRPNDPSLLMMLGIAYAVRGESESRREDLTKALVFFLKARRDKQDELLLFNLALLYKSLSMNAEALSTWHAFIATEPSREWRQEADRRINQVP